jgi:Holliday junction resolvase RusA-like endonuclease
LKQVKLFIPKEPVPQARPRARVVWPAKDRITQITDMAVREMKKSELSIYNIIPKLIDKIKSETWVSVYDVAASRNYKRWVAKCAYNGVLQSPFSSLFPLDVPLIVGFKFLITRPKSVTRAVPSVKPDLDNYIKAVVDGLTGVIWRDDSVIVGYTDDTIKLYANPAQGQAVGVHVIVRPWGQEEFPNSQESLEFSKTGGRDE